MPDALTDSALPEDDDALADLVADRLVDLAIEQGGHWLLVARQMAGLLPEPRFGVNLSERALADAMGESRRSVRKTTAIALSALRRNTHFESYLSPEEAAAIGELLDHPDRLNSP